MEIFQELKVPEQDDMPDSDIYSIQDWECAQVTDGSDCFNLYDCGECIFYRTNIEKFKKWIMQKAL